MQENDLREHNNRNNNNSSSSSKSVVFNGGGVGGSCRSLGGSVSSFGSRHDGGSQSGGSQSSSQGSASEYVRTTRGSLVMVDLVNFRDLARLLSPARLARMLSRFIDAVDAALPVYCLTGSAFVDGRIVAFGARTKEHANDAVRFGLHCLQFASGMPVDEKRPQSGMLALRVAVHSGAIAVLHQRSIANHPPCFIGQAANETALLMQHGGTPGEICCSQAAAAELGIEAFDSVVLCSEEPWDGKPSPKLGLRVRPAQASQVCCMCPNTLRLTFQPGPMNMPGLQLPGSFGFQTHELRHLRMLFGPDTDTPRFQFAIDQTTKRMKRHAITTTLYTRTGNPTRVRISLDYVPSLRQLTLTCTEPSGGDNNNNSSGSFGGHEEEDDNPNHHNHDDINNNSGYNTHNDIDDTCSASSRMTGVSVVEASG